MTTIAPYEDHFVGLELKMEKLCASLIQRMDKLEGRVNLVQ